MSKYMLDPTHWYHVRISVQDQVSDETKIDLSADELELFVLNPYREGSAITINGRVIPVNQVVRVRIGVSSETASNWLGAIRSDMATLRLSPLSGPSVEWRAADRATDITDRLITGPPGTIGSAASSRPAAAPVMGKEPNTIFLVAGRDNAIISAVKIFLRAMQVVVVEWEQAVELADSPNPYVGDVVEIGMAMAEATLVLLTPDDVVQLRDDLLLDEDGADERRPRGQARPNVLYEAGFADALGRGRTIIVEAGPVKPFTDISGRHTVRLDGGAVSRSVLANRLTKAGLSPNRNGTDWMTHGDIEGAIRSARSALTAHP